jgi:hypothetical protein
VTNLSYQKTLATEAARRAHARLLMERMKSNGYHHRDDIQGLTEALHIHTEAMLLIGGLLDDEITDVTEAAEAAK